MLDAAHPAAQPLEDPERRNALQRFLDNPVIMKEIRSRMRGSRAFVLLTVYLIVISLVVGLVYAVAVTSPAAADYGPNSLPTPAVRQGIGKAIFASVVLLELLLTIFVGPALTSGAVSGERERQTLDLLRITPLRARSLVLGKLGASLLYLILLMLATVPIESTAFFFGGVGSQEVVVSSLMLVICALFFCSLGLFFSSFMKRAVGANVGAYVVIVLSTVLLVVTLIWLGSSQGSGASTSSQRSAALIMWMLMSTNPLLAAATSEAALLDSHSVISTTLPVGSGTPITVPLPWIPLVGLYVVLSAVLILVSIYFVSRPDR